VSFDQLSLRKYWKDLLIVVSHGEKLGNLVTVEISDKYKIFIGSCVTILIVYKL
jgi:hypothetical protein